MILDCWSLNPGQIYHDKPTRKLLKCWKTLPAHSVENYYLSLHFSRAEHCSIFQRHVLVLHIGTLLFTPTTLCFQQHHAPVVGKRTLITPLTLPSQHQTDQTKSEIRWWGKMNSQDVPSGHLGAKSRVNTWLTLVKWLEIWLQMNVNVASCLFARGYYVKACGSQAVKKDKLL